MLVATRHPSQGSARDKRPNGCESVVDQRGRGSDGKDLVDRDDSHVWGKDLGDQLSLEELPLDGNAITAAVEKDSIGMACAVGASGPKRRPRSSLTRASLSTEDAREDGLAGDIGAERADVIVHARCNDNARRLHLLHRVKQAANQLAKLQVMTASRAADAACDHHRLAEDSRDTQRLRVELRTLLITLDHLTRLSLEQAFITRDALETHR